MKNNKQSVRYDIKNKNETDIKHKRTTSNSSSSDLNMEQYYKNEEFISKQRSLI